MKPVKRKCRDCAVENNEYRCAMCKWKTLEWMNKVKPWVTSNNDNFIPKEDKKK